MKYCPQCGSSYEDTIGFCHRDGEVLEESPADMVGEVLDGQYEIETFIARGGMGALYRARHILLGDRVVIKTLRSEMRHNTEWLRRFQREGRAARRFRHPNAVTVYDLRTTPAGLIYMVMEFVEGRTLDKELKERGRFTPEEALEVLEPVASVLEAAHAQGVVHRDLKPENVMLNRTADGQLVVKLLDLGIAKLRDVAETQVSDAAGLTVAGQILGTPYYMSPEQWGDMPRDQNPEIDGRADIYSLGVMFYELMTGSKPLTGKSLPELRQAHVNQVLPPLNEVAPGVPESYARAIARAIAKDRSDRQSTAGELADEIRAAYGLPPMPRAAYAAAPSSSSMADLSAGVPSGVGTAPPVNAPANGSAVKTSAAREIHRTIPSPDSVVTAVAAGGNNSFVAHPRQPPVVAGAASVPVAPAQDVRRASASKVPLLAGVAVLLLLVAGVAVSGWFLWQRWQARVVKPAIATNVEPNKNSNAVASIEAISYWLEAFSGAGTDPGQRVAQEGELRLASGQLFKFHFTPRERGYFYIIGPGEGNAPMTFLTAQPVGVLKTNQSAAGADFIFPYGKDKNGEEYVLELDRNPGTEEYTVIFSPMPLLSPAFLAAPAGHQLTPAEIKEWEEFRAQHKTAAPVLDVKDNSEGQPAVSVSVPLTAQSQPLFFDIRIRHQ